MKKKVCQNCMENEERDFYIQYVIFGAMLGTLLFGAVGVLIGGFGIPLSLWIYRRVKK